MMTVSRLCMCAQCTERTGDIYRMVGHCRNCGARPIPILYRSGDRAGDADCPKCGNYNSVSPDRLATDDEIPEATP